MHVQHQHILLLFIVSVFLTKDMFNPSAVFFHSEKDEIRNRTGENSSAEAAACFFPPKSQTFSLLDEKKKILTIY